MSDKPVLFLAAVAVLTACGHNSDGQAESAVPRPRAYPRPDLPERTLRLLEGDSVTIPLNVNAAAVVRSTPVTDSAPGAVTVEYPAGVGATVYYTIIPSENEDSRKQILSARQERISLNLNGTPAETIHKTDGDAEIVVVTALSVSQTPVQMLADIGGKWIVSSTAFMHDNKGFVDYDSIRPVYEYLRADALEAISKTP